MKKKIKKERKPILKEREKGKKERYIKEGFK